MNFKVILKTVTNFITILLFFWAITRGFNKESESERKNLLNFKCLSLFHLAVALNYAIEMLEKIGMRLHFLQESLQISSYQK